MARPAVALAIDVFDQLARLAVRVPGTQCALLAPARVPQFVHDQYAGAAVALFAAQGIAPTVRALAGHLAVRIVLDAYAGRLAVDISDRAAHLTIWKIRGAGAGKLAIDIHAAAFHGAIGIKQQQLALRLALDLRHARAQLAILVERFHQAIGTHAVTVGARLEQLATLVISAVFPVLHAIAPARPHGQLAVRIVARLHALLYAAPILLHLHFQLPVRVIHAVVAHQLAAQVIRIVELANQPLRFAFAHVHYLDLPGARHLSWRQRQDQRIARLFQHFAARQVVVQVQTGLAIGTVRIAAAQHVDDGDGFGPGTTGRRTGTDAHEQGIPVAYHVGKLGLHDAILFLVQSERCRIHAQLPAATSRVVIHAQHVASHAGRRGLDRRDHLALHDLGVGQHRQQQHGAQQVFQLSARHACSFRTISGAGGASPHAPWALPAT